MATFGNRGVSSSAPSPGRRNASLYANDPRAAVRTEGSFTTEELERVRRWKTIVAVLPLMHWAMAAVIGIAALSSPVLFVALAMILGMQYVGMALVIAFLVVVVGINVTVLYGQTVIGQHEANDPSTVKGFMRRTPSVFVVGTVIAVVWFACFSGHGLNELFTDFSIQKMLAFEVYSGDERSVWMEFWDYVFKAWLGTGVLFFFLDKHFGDRKGES